MTPFDPDLLGPITRPIFDTIVAQLRTVDERVEYLDGSALRDLVVVATNCNPKTYLSMLDTLRAFGLIYGVRRIRPTTLGRAWLDQHTPSRNAR